MKLIEKNTTSTVKTGNMQTALKPQKPDNNKLAIIQVSNLMAVNTVEIFLTFLGPCSAAADNLALQSFEDKMYKLH